jgi:hypothetical protein
VSEAGKSHNSPPPLAGGGRGEGAPGASLLSHARALRRDATPAERRLWQGLRRHQVGGLKFRRQVPLGPYIADFYWLRRSWSSRLMAFRTSMLLATRFAMHGWRGMASGWFALAIAMYSRTWREH